MKNAFHERIALMNAMYRLPANGHPTLPSNVAKRLVRFKATLLDEVHEIDEISAMVARGVDGKPIYDTNGKFLKGPNYWKPEPRIKALLQSRGIRLGTAQ